MDSTEIQGARSIEVLLHSIFPNGSENDGLGIRKCPRWPPDLFACTSLLLERSGAYTHPAFFYMEPSFASETDLTDWRKLGESYASSRNGLGKGMSKFWNSIIKARHRELLDLKVARYAMPPDWVKSSFILMHIADIACAGVGVGHNDAYGEDSPYEEIRMGQILEFAQEHKSRLARISNIDTLERDYQRMQTDINRLDLPEKTLPYVPYSICKSVPPHIACVQPKAMTPQVGQTIRSFSHNLALLPPNGEVCSYWFNLQTPVRWKPEIRQSETRPDEDEVGMHRKKTSGLNILLIPYPYHIEGQCFTATKRNSKINTFQIKPLWLKSLADHVRGQAHHLISGIEALVCNAEREIGKIDVIVFPELSMTHAIAEEVSSHFFSRPGNTIKLFLAGVRSERLEFVETEGADDTITRKRPMNAVYIRASWRGFPLSSETDNKRYTSIRRLQVKHHRWQMDERQISNYNLTSQLDISRTVSIPDESGPQFVPKPVWWEDADIIERECLFWVVKNDYVISAVICEDLARIDPVQQVLRSVGPNLLFVLLMDGPQLGDRWASRYATCLSDDPGTSVVTLTSLGMVRRLLNSTVVNNVGLWRDAFSQTTELVIPPGCGAIALNLVEQEIPERTASQMEQISPPELSRKLRLGSVVPIEAPAGSEKKMFLFL